MNFALGSSRFPRGEDAKDPGDEFRRQIRETKQHKNIDFHAYHSLIKWDAYDVEYTASNARRCHPDHQNSFRVHPGNRAEVFMWQNF